MSTAYLDSLIKRHFTFHQAQRAFRRDFLLQVLTHFRGNQCHAARAIGLHRNTLGKILRSEKITSRMVRLMYKADQRERALLTQSADSLKV